MKRNDLPINIGGLYRCCLQTYAAWADADPAARVTEGERLQCEHCKAPMVIRGGVMQWDNQREKKPAGD